MSEPSDRSRPAVASSALFGRSPRPEEIKLMPILQERQSKDRTKYIPFLLAIGPLVIFFGSCVKVYAFLVTLSFK